MRNLSRGVRMAMTLFLFSMLVPQLSMLVPNSASATPTQEEVFKDIQNNVGGSTDPKNFFAFMAGVAGLVILITVLNQRKKRQVQPKIFNHQGKLLKEISRHIDLRPAEIKQLKTLAEDQGMASPLTFLLCPSLLAKAVKESSGKVDRKAILGVAKKLG